MNPLHVRHHAHPAGVHRHRRRRRCHAACAHRRSAVALLIIFGMIIGPSMLDLAHEDPGIGMLKELGVGALFLHAA